jgi:hypothetical protein
MAGAGLLPRLEGGNTRQMVLPPWVSVLLGVDRLVWYGFRAFEVLRDELMFAALSPSAYDRVTQSSYAGLEAYLPGGSIYALGLFPWEIDVLRDDVFPRSGRVLLGAAGGGRELAGLLDRGYDVVAFEPNPVLVRGATYTAVSKAKATVIEASYGDLVMARRRGTGPLAEAVREGVFDACILGWGSLTHVVDARQRRDLFQTLREIAPSGPVVASFFLRAPEPASSGRSGAARRAIRRLAARLGRPPVADGLGFQRAGGFTYSFSKEEIVDLATTTGYRIHLLTEREFPHAVFLPA